MYEIILSDAASSDLVGIVGFIAKNSVDRAYKYRDFILKQLDNLIKEPLLGAPSKLKRLKTMGYRFLIIENHIAHYQVDESKKQIFIVRVLHAMMEQEKHL